MSWWCTARELQREGKHVTSALLTRKGLHLPGFSGGSREIWVQFSRVFSYSISREISKGTQVREDTETLMCFEDPKYLTHKDALLSASAQRCYHNARVPLHQEEGIILITHSLFLPCSTQKSCWHPCPLLSQHSSLPLSRDRQGDCLGQELCGSSIKYCGHFVTIGIMITDRI